MNPFVNIINLSLLADRQPWPNALDLAAMTLLGTVGIGVPALGYVFMVLDYRAYLRSLRRTLMIIRDRMPYLPDWVRDETPPCVSAFGLRMPCSERELLSAYRAQVKPLHPDRGGDRQRFLRLQRQFELALDFVRRMEAERG